MILFDLSFDTFYNCYYLFAYDIADMTPIRFASVVFTCLSSVQTLIDVAIYMQHIDAHKRHTGVTDEIALRFKNVADRALHFGQVPVVWLRGLFHAFGVVCVTLGVLLLVSFLGTVAALDAHCGAALLGNRAAWLKASPRVYFTSDRARVLQAPPSGTWNVWAGSYATCRFEKIVRWDASDSGVTADMVGGPAALFLRLFHTPPLFSSLLVSSNRTKRNREKTEKLSQTGEKRRDKEKLKRRKKSGEMWEQGGASHRSESRET